MADLLQIARLSFALGSSPLGFLLDFLFGLLLLHGLGRFFLGFLLDIYVFAHGLHSSDSPGQSMLRRGLSTKNRP